MTTITDHLSGQPVRASVAIGDKLVSAATINLEVALPAQMSEFITISAPGYEKQQFRLNYRIKSHKVITMPVELVALGSSS